MIGKVISDKMTKTAVVAVQRLVAHPIYKKRIKKNKKLKVENTVGAKVGDSVRIESTRPLSAQKHFRIVEVVKDGTES